MKSLLLLACIFMAIGCATTANYEKKLQTWMGSDVNALIASWGPPDQVFPMSNGNKIYSYAKNGGATSQLIYGTVYTTSYWCKTNFTTDPSDKIINWAWEGNSCKSK
jgi:hypothetical protein